MTDKLMKDLTKQAEGMMTSEHRNNILSAVKELKVLGDRNHNLEQRMSRMPSKFKL